MKFWAIQHIPTGFYFPQLTGKLGKGGTHIEPANPEVTPPRLFKTKAHARQALAWWLKGKVSTRMNHGSHGYKFKKLECNKVRSRRIEDMRVVEFELKQLTPNSHRVPPMTQPHEYIHIKAWGIRGGSHEYYVKAEQERAADENAPINAIYRTLDSLGNTCEWLTADRLASDHDHWQYVFRLIPTPKQGSSP